MIVKFENQNSKPENRIYKSKEDEIVIGSKEIIRLLYDQDEYRWFIIN
jgi:hypothetical protein